MKVLQKKIVDATLLIKKNIVVNVVGNLKNIAIQRNIKKRIKKL